MQSISFIQHNAVNIDFISYQAITYVQGGFQYLRAINLVTADGQFIDKIKLTAPYIKYDKSEVEKVVKDYILNSLKSERNTEVKSRAKSKKNKSQNNEARYHAAESLFNNLGI